MIGLDHFLVLSLLALLANCHQVRFVYRADTRPWHVIQKDGGFRTLAQAHKLKPNYSLYFHARPKGKKLSEDDDGYVSTSWDKNVGIGWVKEYLNGNAYLYKISTHDHFIDLQTTLKTYNPCPSEREYGVKDGIQWRFVSEWTQYINNKPQKTYRNRDFDVETINWLASGPQYQLAGFPVGYKAWSQEPWRSEKNNPHRKFDSSKSSYPFKADAVHHNNGYYGPSTTSSKPYKPNIVEAVHPNDGYYGASTTLSEPYKPNIVEAVHPNDKYYGPSTSSSKYYKKSDTMGGRGDLVHFAIARAAQAAANETTFEDFNGCGYMR